VTFLFDENLSWRLVKRVSDMYPGCVHINELGLERGADSAIWKRAGELALAIVSKDDDFRQRAMVFGSPPKTVWLRLGNASTRQIETVLRDREGDVRAFLGDTEESILILQGPK